MCQSQIAEVVYDQLPGNDLNICGHSGSPFLADPVMAKKYGGGHSGNLIKVDKKNKDSYGKTTSWP